MPCFVPADDASFFKTMGIHDVKDHFHKHKQIASRKGQRRKQFCDKARCDINTHAYSSFDD
jgi:hypothetical protein